MTSHRSKEPAEKEQVDGEKKTVKSSKVTQGERVAVLVRVTRLITTAEFEG